jgi:glucokinase
VIELRYLVGIDLGGTNIAVGIVNSLGEIISKISTPTKRGRTYQLIVEDMARLVKEITDKEKIEMKDIIGIGIGSPGIVDLESKRVIYSCNLFKNAPLCSELGKYFNVPIFIENDGNCAALGESFCGAAKGTASSLTVTIGTGIGGGLVLNGKIFRGFNYAGIEIGHHVIKIDGESCTCGRNGCWEAYSSATALIRNVKRAIKEYPSSIISELCCNDEENINAKIVFDAYHLKDPTAKIVISEYFSNLAIGLTNMINIFQPEVIVLSGGISNQGEQLLESIHDLIQKSVYTRHFVDFVLPQTRIKIASLGNDAGIVGAAILALRKGYL